MRIRVFTASLLNTRTTVGIVNFLLERAHALRGHLASCLTAATILMPLTASAQSPGPGMSQRAALRILDQATWGPTPGSLTALQQAGFDAWFAGQVNAPLSTLPAQPLLATDGTRYTSLGPLHVSFYANTLNGTDQLRQRVTFALSEIWVVSDVDLNRPSAFPPYMKLIQNRAFDNYEALMKDVTLSPAMGNYLNMVNNNKGSATNNTSANENYARELMQLFTLGLNQLNDDGSVVVDSEGNPVPTYTQDTITNLAKMLTGWTYAPLTGATDQLNNPENYQAQMIAHESEHDTTTKTLFGVSVPAGQTAAQDINEALTIIFDQPSLPPFVSQQLIQHLVTSNPSAAYVSRISAVFKNNGNGVRGDLKAVIYAILTDPEARAGDTGAPSAVPNFGHLREPVLFLAGLLRSLSGTLTATSNVEAYGVSMEQNLFNAPTVFSYFPPNYQVNGLMMPEMAIYDTQSSVARTAAVNAAVYGGELDDATKFNLTPYMLAASTTSQTGFFDLVNEWFFHGAMSTGLKASMQQAMSGVTAPADKAKAGLYIALTSSEYQVIH